MITIWHNPRCSKSRQTLALLEGREVEVRKYLEDAPSVDELRAAQAALGLRAIDMMRPKEALFKELGLTKDTPEAALLDAMAAHPKLIERPIVFANGKARLGRPPEQVLEIL
ncbi:arsenate reductase (glutaredoxin) [Thalassobius sp. S69A]|uniref:arsenate reductase (glutaredoxin) n=1 Tax=unclassified Thalassovita TaxID=2619711 RepID=UPI000C10E58C|nr:arsenate reductase (glutaredoxin) [Paracoccaceae bacterium]MBT25162.1 arsenate reductase (glutaredoxin) [Paracoccaceae bacterium]